jgi:hypothetical protein
MQVTSHTHGSWIRRGALFLALASLFLAVVGIVISSIWSGDTASETAVSDFGWTLLNLSTVAAMVFLAVFAISVSREQARR